MDESIDIIFRKLIRKKEADFDPDNIEDEIKFKKIETNYNPESDIDQIMTKKGFKIDSKDADDTLPCNTYTNGANKIIIRFRRIYFNRDISDLNPDLKFYLERESNNLDKNTKRLLENAVKENKDFEEKDNFFDIYNIKVMSNYDNDILDGILQELKTQNWRCLSILK